MKLTNEQAEARRQALIDVRSAIRYGDLLGPLGEEMRKPAHLQRVGGMLLVFEEWFENRFADELSNEHDKDSTEGAA